MNVIVDVDNKKSAMLQETLPFALVRGEAFNILLNGGDASYFRLGKEIWFWELR